jgi:hypothetical protein
MVQADTSIVETVRQDLSAATHFLNIIAQSWKKLIVDNKKQFTEPGDIMRAYWESDDDDSVSVFLRNQVSREDDAATLHKDSLYLAYKAWCNYADTTGKLETHASRFKTRVMSFYTQHPPESKQVSAVIFETTPEGSLFCSGQTMPRKHCFLGMKLKPSDAYPKLEPRESSEK